MKGDFEVIDHYLYHNGEKVAQRPSPNHGGTIEPTLIVVHYDGTDGLGGLSWLTQSGSNVSAHFWISKEGRIVQLLPMNSRGWHAGKSEWDGKPDCNSYSIGVECQGVGTSEWPKAQMDALIDVLIAIHKAYSIEGIAGHDEIAIPFGRKTDPGKFFNWDVVYKSLADAGFNYE